MIGLVIWSSQGFRTALGRRVVSQNGPCVHVPTSPCAVLTVFAEGRFGEARRRRATSSSRNHRFQGSYADSRSEVSPSRNICSWFP